MALPDPRASVIWRDQKGPDGVIEQGGLETDPYNPPKGNIRTWAEFIEDGLDVSLPTTGGTLSGDLELREQDNSGATARRLIFASGRTATPPLSGDILGEIFTRSLDTTNASVRTRPMMRSRATENHDHVGTDSVGNSTEISFVQDGTSTEIVGLDLSSAGTILKARNGSTGQQLATDPAAWGCDPGSADTVNDAAFTTMAANIGDATADLHGRAYPVTAIPSINAKNGFWIVTNFEEGLEAYIPAPDTLDVSVLEIDGGGRCLGWPQDTMAGYDGRVIGSYMSADGHVPGQYNVTYFWTDQGGRSIERFEPGTFYGASPAFNNESFAAGIFPPSLIYDGPAHVALVRQSDGTLRCYYRFLSQYDQTTVGGGLVQAETAWTEALAGGVTLGLSLRTAMDAQYTITTSGVPTVTHSLTFDGSQNDARFAFGFHGLSGASTGPHVAYCTGDPRTGSISVDFVARIGLLTQGVEPSVCWYNDGGASELVGFIRSQGGSYPIRFFVGELTQAGMEGAAVQDCPFGNDLGTTSPIPCRIRPRRKNGTDGWAANATTIAASTGQSDADNELHFVFTGTRTRDGGPGEVNLYWGRVTRGTGVFNDLWTRAQITLIDTLYFANSNATDTTNQVGIPSLAFADANTLVIGVADERPAVKDDKDESFLRFYTIKFSDRYADAPRNYDDGSSRPVVRQQAPEYAPYGGQVVSYGAASPVRTINGGGLRYTGAFMRVAPEAGTTDDLTDVYGGYDGARLVIKSNSSTNTITLRDATGSAGSLLSLTADMALDNARDFIELMYDAGSGSWLEVSRSDNS